jgi:DinB superfamily
MRFASSFTESGLTWASEGHPMMFDLDHGYAVLERTPAVLRALLVGLPPRWITSADRPEAWSPFDVVGHLIDGEETDWLPRARLILTHGRAQPFQPFDRQRHRRRNQGRSPEALVEEFTRLRSANLAALRALHLTPSQLALEGEHPELGLVTLAQLLATWVAHDLTHLAQITRTMARQYGEAVGPWRAYLPALQP